MKRRGGEKIKISLPSLIPLNSVPPVQRTIWQPAFKRQTHKVFMCAPAVQRVQTATEEFIKGGERIVKCIKFKPRPNKRRRLSPERQRIKTVFSDDTLDTETTCSSHKRQQAVISSALPPPPPPGLPAQGLFFKVCVWVCSCVCVWGGRRTLLHAFKT